jgi:hypothetical protein
VNYPEVEVIMKRAMLLVCCLLPACPPTNSPVAPASCRESDGPKDCKPPLGIGGHQGGFLEGNGLERLHFQAAAFPPAAGTTLAALDACGAPSAVRVLIKSCAAVGDASNPGAYACEIDGVAAAPGSLAPVLPPICTTELANHTSDPDPFHSRGVLAVRGFWDPTGAWQDAPNTVTLSCDASANKGEGAQFDEADGAITKCIRIWQLDPKATTEAFLGCIRMARADYCGDGHPHTYGGTEVSLATPHSPMTVAECKDGFCFEASWNKNGAVCLARPRWTGKGMEINACRQQFTQSGAFLCRGQPDQGIVFSRSAQHVCKQVPTVPCAPDQDPVCVNP